MAALVNRNAVDKTNVSGNDKSQRTSRALKATEVDHKTRIGKTKRIALINKGLFPSPFQMPGVNTEKGRTNFWFEHDIDEWLFQQQKESRQQAAKVVNDPLNAWMQSIKASKMEAA